MPDNKPEAKREIPHKNQIILEPIGMIYSPFTEIADMPIQPVGASGISGYLQIYEAYQEGIESLDGFSHIILLYYFHQNSGYKLTVTPFLDKQSHGLFSTRAPRRPNPIGLSVVKLASVDGLTIHIENVDILNGTPLLDIKPYVPEFDAPQGAIRTGWLDQTQNKASSIRSDHRFGDRPDE